MELCGTGARASQFIFPAQYKHGSDIILHQPIKMAEDQHPKKATKKIPVAEMDLMGVRLLECR